MFNWLTALRQHVPILRHRNPKMFIILLFEMKLSFEYPKVLGIQNYVKVTV